MKWQKWLGLLYFVGWSMVAASAQTVDQLIPLQAGWNAVFLEVDPANRAPAAVLANLPVACVWTYKTRPSTVQFIQTQSETNFNTDEWMVYYPTNRPESFRNTLFALLPQRPYLIRCTNAAILTVSGQPVWRAAEWVPNEYNLKGFDIHPSRAPTFKGYFQSSAAHFVIASDQLSEIYRLQANGQWAQVSNTDPMRRGECYWVMCNGGSDYAGPLDVQLMGGNLLDFGESTDQLLLRIRNRGTAILNVALSDRQAATPLSYGSWTATAGNTWVTLAHGLNMTLNPGEISTLRLSINRSQFNGATYASILDLVSDNGMQIVLGVRANKSVASAGGTTSLAGLWVGNAVIEEVSEPAHMTSPSQTTPVKSPLTLRLLIHVDGGGTARLLKEVTQMMKPATYTTTLEGLKQEASPPKPVLVTDDRLLSQFQGSVLKGGKLVGRRWSTAGYDFEAGTNGFAVFNGVFAQNNTVSTTLNIPSSLPTNPFLHRYHPDHDNLDAQFKGAKEEAYPFTRQLTLTLGGADTAEPGAGYRVMTGVYQEQVKGVHRSDIYLKGTFRLQRVVNLGVLNVAP